MVETSMNGDEALQVKKSTNNEMTKVTTRETAKEVDVSNLDEAEDLANNVHRNQSLDLSNDATSESDASPINIKDNNENLKELQNFQRVYAQIKPLHHMENCLDHQAKKNCQPYIEDAINEKELEYDNDSQLDDGDVSEQVLIAEIESLRKQNKFLQKKMRKREIYEEFDIIGVKKTSTPPHFSSNPSIPRSNSGLHSPRSAIFRSHSQISRLHTLPQGTSPRNSLTQGQSPQNLQQKRYQLAPSHRFDPDSLHERLSTVIPSSLRAKRNQVSKNIRKDEFRRRNGFEAEIGELIKEYKPRLKRNYKLPLKMEDRSWNLIKMHKSEEKRKQKLKEIGSKIEASLWNHANDHAWLLSIDDNSFEREMNDRLLGMYKLEQNDRKRFERNQEQEEENLKKEILLRQLKREQEEFLTCVQQDLDRYTYPESHILHENDSDTNTTKGIETVEQQRR